MWEKEGIRSEQRESLDCDAFIIKTTTNPLVCSETGMSLCCHPKLGQRAWPHLSDQSLDVGCSQEGDVSLAQAVLFNKEQSHPQKSIMSCQPPIFPAAGEMRALVLRGRRPLDGPAQCPLKKGKQLGL